MDTVSETPVEEAIFLPPDPVGRPEAGVGTYTPGGRNVILKHHFGQVNQYLTQHIMSGLHANDRETGERVECAQDKAGTWRVWGGVRGCNQGGVSLNAGSADGKVAVLSGADSSVSWTMGSPCHWSGAWDEFAFA